MATAVDPLLEAVHGGYVHRRRVRVLCDHLASMIPAGTTSLLDVGCGDGWLAAKVGQARPELKLAGLDVLVRPGTHIPVEGFDGKKLPCADGSWDAVMMVDVLHHTEDPSVLLNEAAEANADLIVMGGYGHSRLREMVLGGATRTLLRQMTAPVLMSH